MAEPIGSIVAFAGDVDLNWEATNGWMRCDGRQLQVTNPANIPLFNAIKFNWGGDGQSVFYIPDLQGYFLRGIDVGAHAVRDKDRSTRTANNRGGSEGVRIGSVQGFATAFPTNPFKAERVGKHDHALNFEIDATRDVADQQPNTVAYPAPSEPAKPSTDRAGDHEHTITGGDKETRPINAYVHWIIRYR